MTAKFAISSIDIINSNKYEQYLSPTNLYNHDTRIDAMVDVFDLNKKQEKVLRSDGEVMECGIHAPLKRVCLKGLRVRIPSSLLNIKEKIYISYRWGFEHDN